MLANLNQPTDPDCNLENKEHNSLHTIINLSVYSFCFKTHLVLIWLLWAPFKTLNSLNSLTPSGELKKKKKSSVIYMELWSSVEILPEVWKLEVVALPTRFLLICIHLETWCDSDTFLFKAAREKGTGRFQLCSAARMILSLSLTLKPSYCTCTCSVPPQKKLHCVSEC